MKRTPVERVDVSAFVIPTDAPEADGTFEWQSTTLVVVEARAGDVRGIGYTYASTATARLIADTLAEVVRGSDVMAIPACWTAMVRSVRNVGRQGIASTAIASVDVALWDLKARVLGISTRDLPGVARERVCVYGSGSFTSYDTDRLCTQLAGWVEQGITAVKMKVGRDRRTDSERVRLARQAIGDNARLFVDANGGYSRKEALQQAERFGQYEVSWFEEPVSSDDLAGLRFIRERAPSGMDIAAGEYGFDARPPYATRVDFRCRRTPPRRCTGLFAAPRQWPVMWSISTITPESSRCSSTARSCR